MAKRTFASVLTSVDVRGSGDFENARERRDEDDEDELCARGERER